VVSFSRRRLCRKGEAATGAGRQWESRKGAAVR
jgi:hypothetical protein